MLPINQITDGLGIPADMVENYGKYKAKIGLELIDYIKDRPQGKYVVVTAITPTPLGEGKTTTCIGLGQAMGKLGKRVVNTIRQPSLGPVFGIKGGAAGGGYAQCVPMEDFNLHFTGDTHAVALAHNLLGAFMDSSLLHGNPTHLDPLSITWPRVVDVSDRALRKVVIGLGGSENGIPRETGFDIAVASEVMAILALASDVRDLRRRLGRIQVACDEDGKPVTADDLGFGGAMTVLMKDALKPNLIQGLDNGACFVHAGPFANIAIGTNSIVADRVALKLGDYVVTEAGFGADMGAEKFLDIKCRIGHMQPSCVVIVATLKALKLHGGAFTFPPGKKPPKEEIETPNPAAVEKGAENLVKHVENMVGFGLPVVVAINRFPYDTPEEIAIVARAAKAAGAVAAVESHVHARGGEGGADLARAVVAACQQPANFKFLYELDEPIKQKIEKIATRIYGADGVDYEPEAEKKIKAFEEQGLGNLPICMAKTHLSLSHDPNLKGRPTGYRLPVRDVRPSVGAGFLYPLCGTMSTMPGLPTRPAAVDVDVDEAGNIVGLF